MLGNEYTEYTADSAKAVFSFLEVSGKVKHYEPKPTLKYTIYKTEGGGVLRSLGEDVSAASKSLLTTYPEGRELINNVDIFIQPCPVCSRYSHAGGQLLYCPECDKLELIAYPKVGFYKMIGIDPEYHDDQIDRCEDLDDEEFWFLKG